MGTAPVGKPAPAPSTSTPSAPQSTPVTQGATTTPTPSSATPPGADSGWPPGAKEAAQAAGAAAQKARQEGKPLPAVCDPSKKAYWERPDIKAWAEANAELAKRLKEKEGFRDSPPSNRTQELEKIPNNGETSPAWARRAAEVAAQPGGKQTLGSLTITSTTVPATSSTAGDSAEVSYNVTVAVGDSRKTAFRIGQNGTITGVHGDFDAVNNQIAAHNKAHKSKALTQGHAPQTELEVARVAFDEAMEGTVGWALEKGARTANTSGGSFTSSSYSNVGTPPRAPIDPMSSSTSGSCYLRVEKGQGGEKMELVIKGRQIVGYSKPGQPAVTQLTEEDFGMIRRFIWEVNPVTEKKP